MAGPAIFDPRQNAQTAQAPWPWTRQNESASVMDSPWQAFARMLKRAVEGGVDLVSGASSEEPLNVMNPSLEMPGGGGLAAVPAVVAAIAKHLPEGLRAKAPIKAYHGSPYKFDKFDASKIGTGEGAQAYGHGLYFAENENVAKAYRESLTGRIPGAAQGHFKQAVKGTDPPKGITGHMALDTAQDLDGLLYYIKHGHDEMAQVVKGNIERRVDRFRVEDAKGYHTGSAGEDMRALADYYDAYVRPGVRPEDVIERGAGATYEVAIHAEPDTLLDWDKPLSQQPEPVRKGLEREWLAHPEVDKQTPGHRIYKSIAETEEQAAKKLREAGIPGIKYLDASSRNPMRQFDVRWDATNTMAEVFNPQTGQAIRTFPSFKDADAWVAANTTAPATHNYVIFDDRLIEILRQYGLLGLLGGGLAAQQSQASAPLPEAPR